MAFVEPSVTPDTVVIKDILSALLRGWKSILLVFFATLLSVYAGLMYVTEQYEAEARVLVKLGRENAQIPITVEKGGVYATGVQKEEINSYVQLLASRGLIKATVDVVGAERFLAGPPPPETFFQTIKYYIKMVLRWVKQQSVNFLILLDLKKALADEDKVVSLALKSLSVERERDSNVIRIFIRLADPYLAKDFLETLLDLYLKRHIDLRRNLVVSQVFEVDSVSYRKQLNELQSKILGIKQQWNISATDSQRAGMITRMEQLKTEMNTRRTELAGLTGERQTTLEKLERLPLKSLGQIVEEPNPARKTIKNRLVDLRVQRAGKLNRYVDNSESVAILDQEIASLEVLLKQEAVTQQGKATYIPDQQRMLLKQALQDNEIHQIGLKAELARGKLLVDKMNKEFMLLNEGESQLRLAELEWAVLEKKYLANAARREEARISASLDAQRVANIVVMSPPSVNPEPVKPRKILILVIGMVMGLLLGIGVTLLREWSQGTVYAAQDLKEIEGLDFLGEFRLNPASPMATS